MEKKHESIFGNIFKLEKFDLLVSIYIFCLVTAELMGAKIFPIATIGTFNLNGSVAIFLLPFIYSVNDVITEVYGRFMLMEPAYDIIFKQSIRISIASLLAFAFGDFLDVIIFSKIRKMMGRKALWLRVQASNIISLLVDTVIFMTFAFYDFDKGFSNNFNFLIGLIIPYWLVKCFMSVIETPFVYLGINWLKKEKK